MLWPDAFPSANQYETFADLHPYFKYKQTPVSKERHCTLTLQLTLRTFPVANWYTVSQLEVKVI